MNNTFGHIFRVTTFGESHGVALGCVVDGCPAQIPLTDEIVQAFLNRRRPGQSIYATSRAEEDLCEILSGTDQGVTLGTPIAIIVRNRDVKKQDYKNLNAIFRPGHGDYTTYMKYGVTASSGGGRVSARETIGRVAAAAVAKAFVQSRIPELEVLAWVHRIENMKAQVKELSVTSEQIEASEIRCPDLVIEKQMRERILAVKKEGDSLGGLIRCVVKNVPPGLGAPVFDKLEADLAKAMLSLPATKSFEMGNGLVSTFWRGSDNNDALFLDEQGKVITKTNHCGGVAGGISNGMPLAFSVGFKPVSTIFKAQDTVTRAFEEVNFKLTEGRHDPCVLPRAVPIVEAMVWLVLADHLQR